MSALLVVMIAGSAASLALGIAATRSVGSGRLVAEAAMLAAMLDVHLEGLGLLPTPVWALLLAVSAITAALLDRLRRGRLPGADALHGVGMLLASGLVLVAGAPSAQDPDAQDSAVHAHGGSLPLVLTIAVAVYAVCALAAALRGRPARIHTARRLASLAGLVAMGAMAAVG